MLLHVVVAIALASAARGVSAPGVQTFAAPSADVQTTHVDRVLVKHAPATSGTR